MKVCSEPGCPTLTDQRRCPQHTRTTDRARRGLPALALDLTRPVFRHLVPAEPTGPAWRHALT
jgi:hypothetical protein